MSSKHPHSGGKPHPNPNDHGASEQNRSVTGDMHVRGEVIFGAGPEEKLSRHAAENKQGSKDREKKWLERATLLVVTIYALLTWCLARSSQQSADAASRASNASVASYESTVRPYLYSGITPVTVQPKPLAMDFNVILKNYGSIPAHQVMSTERVLLDGRDTPAEGFPANSPDLPPGSSLSLIGQIGTDNTPLVLKGQKILTIYVAFSYGWRDKQESGCAKYRYEPRIKGFFDLGPICFPN